MAHADSIFELIARADAAAPALGAPGRKPLTYAGLRAQAEKTVAALNRMGVGRNDPVAIVLPNGPEMASAFVCIGAGATTAPLNRAYTEDEFRFYLADLQPRLLVLADGMETPALGVAERLGVPVASLAFDPMAPAGAFDLRGTPAAGRPQAAGLAGANDCALVLHTSGTTARPKIVPLSQRNVCASAAHIAASLALTPADLGMNIMPLFHIHGLVAAVLSSLSAGASVSCTPGFNALQFFAHLAEVKPTWYTAVPTMHQAIATRAARNREALSQVRLRFIRSSSASLPPRVMAEVEQALGVPLIEAYGMTEAAHQMASNPLPPRERKPGSVGVAAGPEIGVMDEAGRLLGAGETGEVVIRGPNVTSGYRGNPQANAAAFTNGWFRTGDLGVLDHEGYLRLTGRLKEIINRGGEKISPREVDEALLDHPAVLQVVTFAVPHDKLGEDVAAAVVLREGAQVSESELRSFASTRLADMKVPRKIVFLAEIPKGATGKLQRIGLAKTLGFA
jgi:acyl-CoA synthetase (AMP-forming)/AMP-acid ligase II